MDQALTESVIVVIPLPPRVLSPNHSFVSIGGRFAKAAAVKKQRRLVKEAIQEEGIETAPWERVIVLPEFFFKVNRRRDEDNAIGSLKAAYDGIVDSGLVIDDNPFHMRRLAPIFSVDPGNPRVVLIITKS